MRFLVIMLLSLPVLSRAEFFVSGGERTNVEFEDYSSRSTAEENVCFELSRQSLNEMFQTSRFQSRLREIRELDPRISLFITFQDDLEGAPHQDVVIGGTRYYGEAGGPQLVLNPRREGRCPHINREEVFEHLGSVHRFAMQRSLGSTLGDFTGYVKPRHKCPKTVSN